MSADLTQTDAMALATELVDQFNRRDFDAMIAMGAGTIDFTDVPLGLHITDAETFRAAMQGWADAFSDVHGTVTSATYDGKVLGYEVIWEGTHDGPLATPMGPIPASGRHLSLRNAFFVVVEGDHTVAVSRYGDTLTMLSQIGAIPAQGAATEAGCVHVGLTFPLPARRSTASDATTQSGQVSEPLLWRRWQFDGGVWRAAPAPAEARVR